MLIPKRQFIPESTGGDGRAGRAGRTRRGGFWARRRDRGSRILPDQVWGQVQEPGAAVLPRGRRQQARRRRLDRTPGMLFSAVVNS